MSNATFGCGVFLPGEGPGNFTQFNGGGTIDGGSGNNGGGNPSVTPVDPQDPIDPQDPDKICACYPWNGMTAENVIFPPEGFGDIAIVLREYDQRCEEFESEEELFAALVTARSVIETQLPPPVVGDWVLVQGPTFTNIDQLGKDCKAPNGECGGVPCPTIYARSVWRRVIGPDPDPTPPENKNPDEVFPCECMVRSLQPDSIRMLGTDNKGCRTWRVEWQYTCRENNNDPLFGIDPHATFPPFPNPGYTVVPGSVVRKGRDYGLPCRGVSPCSDSPCGRSSLEWVECPRERPDSGGSGGITPGPNLGGGAAPPPLQVPPDPGGDGGITPGPNSDNTPGVSTGGETPTTPPPIFIPQSPSPTPVGEGVTYRSGFDSGRLEQSLNIKDIDLNNPDTIREVLKLKPNGIQENSIEFSITPDAPTFVSNDTGITELFKNKIDSNIHYVLKNRNNNRNWDSKKAAGVTYTAVINSLSPEILDIVNKIRNYDGTKLTQQQIFSMIGSRILDGSIQEVTKGFLQSLADDSERRVPTTISRSSIDKVNEVAALILIDQNKIPLDVSKIIGKEKQLFKNFKILSSDIDKFIPVTIEGITKRFYVNDDDTFIDRSTLSISDGDYFDITSGGKVRRLFTQSEKDHAFLLPENVRQKVISLLGGNSGRTLSVSGNKETASSIEYDYSLSTPRQPFYVLSAVLSSVQTSPNPGGSFLLKDTTVRYQLMDTSSASGLDATNEFIKYKANKRIFVLDHEDLIIDYMERTGSVNLNQADVIFNSPKVNKTIPLLVRQIPFYIMIYPTNRSEYNIFNDKSRIISIADDGSVARELKCKTHINPQFTDPQVNKFIRNVLVGREATDVLGTPDTQTQISIIDSNDEVFKTGFRKGNTLMSASEYDVDRSKTGFRLLREIINELDTNYVLSLNGVGKTLTEFDAFSRLTLKQFNILSRLENFTEIKRAISNGLINDVKLIPPIENSDPRIVSNQTQLVQRKSTAEADSFKPIKATANDVTIVSPDTDGVGGFSPAT